MFQEEKVAGAFKLILKCDCHFSLLKFVMSSFSKMEAQFTRQFMVPIFLLANFHHREFSLASVQDALSPYRAKPVAMTPRWPPLSPSLT